MCLAPLTGVSAAAEDGDAAHVQVDLRISRFMDMHFWVRRQAELGSSAETYDGLAEAIEAAKALDADLGVKAGWGLVEGALANCASAGEAALVCEKLPKSFRSRAGGELKLQPGASRLMQAYKKLEPAFLEHVWPEHKRQLEQAKEELTRDLLAKQHECFSYLTTSLAMQPPEATIPMTLVAAAPSPGGFTHRSRGGPVCFVSLDGVSTRSLLHEAILHESIHALDLLTASQDTALQRLRKALAAAGVSPTDPLMRDVPHTLMFVQAGETVKRKLDAEHKHYGDAEGYYAKVPDTTKVVRETWTAYLDGGIDLDHAIEKIVSDARALKSGD